MNESLEVRVRRLEDLHELQQLRARYCQLLDDGKWAALADLFTEDGAFVGLSTARGRPGLIEFFSGLQAGELSAWWHFSSNETLELDGDRATGQTWLYQPCVIAGEAHVAAGRYADIMVRGDDWRWRFEERKVTFFWWVPANQGWDRGAFGYPPAAQARDAGHVG